MEQEILERHPERGIAIYAVWFNMYPGDARVKWPERLLTDRRVSHYWDARRILGMRLLSNLPTFLDRQAPGTLPPESDALWDTFFVYPPADSWTDPFPRPASWGYPIMATKDQLAADMDRLAAR